jgi:hypothetical protein
MDDAPGLGGAAHDGFRGAFTIARAMKALYGSYDPVKGVSVWFVKRPDTHEWWDYFSETEPAELHARFVGSRTVRHQGKEAVLFIAEAVVQRAHCSFCHSIAGIALFVRRNGAWTVEAASRAVSKSDFSDGSPRMKIIRTGTSDYGVLLSTAYSRHGQTDNTRILISLVDKRFRETLVLMNSDWRDDDECDSVYGKHCWHYSTILAPEKPVGKGPWPLLAVTRGTDGQGLPFVEQSRFRFEGGRYIETDHRLVYRPLRVGHRTHLRRSAEIVEFPCAFR